MSNETIKCVDLVKTYNPGQVNEYKALKGVNLSIKRRRLRQHNRLIRFRQINPSKPHKLPRHANIRRGIH